MLGNVMNHFSLVSLASVVHVLSAFAGHVGSHALNLSPFCVVWHSAAWGTSIVMVPKLLLLSVSLSLSLSLSLPLSHTHTHRVQRTQMVRLVVMLKACGRQISSKHFKKLWLSILRVEGEKSSYQMKERCMVSELRLCGKNSCGR